MEIARFVWRQPSRPKGLDTISVRIERPFRTMGDEVLTHEFHFYAEQLNGKSARAVRAAVSGT